MGVIHFQAFNGTDLMTFVGVDEKAAPQVLANAFEIAAKVMQSVLIIAFALVLSHLLRKGITKFFRLPGRADAKSETLSSVLCNFVKYGIAFFAVSEILMLFGVAVGSILALAGIGSVAIGFGAQTIVKDVLTGIFILVENQYNVGDIVRINGMSGAIESVGVRTTKIRDVNGNLHIIPNSSINIVSNLSRDYQRPTIELEFSSSHSAEKVLQMLSDEMETIKTLPGLTKPPVVVGIIDLSPASFKVQIQAECEPHFCWPIEREIRLRVKLRFEKEGITC